MKLRRLLTPLFTIALLGAGGWYVYVTYVKVEAPKIEYQTQAATRGRITASVTASGTLSPVKTVEVGSQVSGRIVELMADFNSTVKKGDVIAHIDPSLLESDKARSKANLLSARASLTKAVADRNNAKVLYERSKKLADSGVASQEEVDAAMLAYTSAKATVESAQAAVSVAQAAIETADVNLQYTTIVSPIDGVVISRDVSVGQTVAASLSAPKLFSIAEDLRAMELHTNVAESDVGVLQPEMQVRFTVDAYPSERFRGVVQQIRNSPQTLQNVVTYDAVVRVDNDQLKLRPGMTASATFIVEDHRDALLIPNAALRFTPSDPKLAALAPPPAEGRGGGRRRPLDDDAAVEARAGDTKAGDAKAGDAKSETPAGAGDAKAGDAPAADGKVHVNNGAPADAKPGTAVDAKHDAKATAADAKADGKDAAVADAKADARGDTAADAKGEGGGRRRGGGGRAASNERTVWVMVDGQPKPLQVKIGISDGTNTEVLEGELTESMQVIVSQSGGETPKAAPTTSPLTGGGGAKGGGGGRRGGF